MAGKIGSEERAIIGMDLGGTKLATAIFAAASDGSVRFIDALDNIHYKNYFETEEPGGLSAEGKSRLIEKAMVGAIETLRERAGVDKIASAGIATAGFVEQGIVVEAWNIGMRNYPLRKRVQEASGVKIFLYKDCWSPIYAVGPDRPCLIFSIGTGFGGVSSGPDLKVSARSYTARKKIIWVPFLYFSDDPSFAASFSMSEIDRAIAAAFEKCRVIGCELPGEITSSTARALFLGKIRAYAKESDKFTPSKMELLVARALAPRAAFRIKSEEIFADAICASAFVGRMYSWMTGREMEPHELDALAASGDVKALAAFHVQAEFIGRVLAAMQNERIELKLTSAEMICGTGSGFNKITAGFLGPSILYSMRLQCLARNIPVSSADKIELIEYNGGNTTLACYGAAVGAAKGIIQE